MGAAAMKFTSRILEGKKCRRGCVEPRKRIGWGRCPGRRGLDQKTTTPAMAAGLTSRLWEIGDILDVLEAWEGRRLD